MNLGGRHHHLQKTTGVQCDQMTLFVQYLAICTYENLPNNTKSCQSWFKCC